MGRSKAEAVETRVALRVLTRSRMIDGTFTSRKPSLDASWGVQWGSDTSTFFYRLEDAAVATFDGVGDGDTDGRRGLVAVAAEHILAAIVRDPTVALTTVDEYARHAKFTVAAGLHVGPFVCTGTVMFPSDPFEKPGSNAILNRRILPVRDATVRCVDPAVGLPDEQSALVFVHVTGLEALALNGASTG